MLFTYGLAADLVALRQRSAIQRSSEGIAIGFRSRGGSGSFPGSGSTPSWITYGRLVVIPPATEPQPLFVYDLDLFVDHLAGKPVDGHVNPVALLTFHDEAIPETCGSRWIPPTLRDHVEHQVPCSRLIHFPKCPRGRLTLGFRNGWTHCCFVCDEIYQARSIDKRRRACGQNQACGQAVCR